MYAQLSNPYPFTSSSDMNSPREVVVCNEEKERQRDQHRKQVFWTHHTHFAGNEAMMPCISVTVRLCKYAGSNDEDEAKDLLAGTMTAATETIMLAYSNEPQVPEKWAKDTEDPTYIPNAADGWTIVSSEYLKEKILLA